MTVLVLAAPVAASKVEGLLQLQSYQPPKSTDQGPRFRWELENGIREVRPDTVPTRELAVVLTGETDGTGGNKVPVPIDGTGDNKVPVPIEGGALRPSTLVLRTGATLDIENLDEIAHDLQAKGLEGFSAEALGPRAQRSVHLSAAGAWPISDALCPHARAHLHVIDDLVAVGILSEGGRFTFANVPSGEYTLRVFHGAAQLAALPVTVAGETTTLGPVTLTPKATR